MSRKKRYANRDKDVFIRRKIGRQLLALREREVKSKRDPIPDKEGIWQVIS